MLFRSGGVGEFGVVADGADDGGGDDAVGVVPGLLAGAALVGGVDHGAHGAGDGVGVEDDAAVEVAGGAPGGLDEGGFGAQEAFLVGVEDGDEGDFGEVEAFAEEVDADEDVELGLAEVAEDGDALEGGDVGVEVAGADVEGVEVFGEVFGGTPSPELLKVLTL